MRVHYGQNIRMGPSSTGGAVRHGHGSDLLYESQHAAVLPKVIKIRPAPGGRCHVLVAVRNRELFDTLVANLRSEGLEVQEHHLAGTYPNPTSPSLSRLNLSPVTRCVPIALIGHSLTAGRRVPRVSFLLIYHHSNTLHMNINTHAHAHAHAQTHSLSHTYANDATLSHS